VTTRRTTLKPDPRGDFRPYIGLRKDGKQQRFNLGTDPSEAERRRDRIQHLYRESVAARRAYGQSPSWTAAALHAAKLIEQGLQHVPVPSATVVNEAVGGAFDMGMFNPCWQHHDPESLVWSHAVASRLYPSVHWIMPDDATGRAAIDFGRMMFDVQARRQARLLDARPPVNPVAGTFHQALDKYDQYIKEDVAKRVTHSTMQQRRDQVKYLKLKHADVPLAFLDLTECRKLFDYWTALPNQDSEKRYSRNTCKHRISELSMFFDWLHSTDQFDWRKPDDFDTISKTIAKDRGKKSIRDLVAKKTFTIEELAIINRHCNSLERLLLYLGLNCSFGASESGRLEEEDLFVREKNPIGHVWEKHGFASDPGDSWIAYLRPKTQVAGCWWLWPETVEAFEVWMSERPVGTTSRIIVSSRGASLYRDESKNGQSGFQNLWGNLIERIRESNPNFPKLPFGTLRDQFSDWAVYQGESETGSIALAHGKPFKDDLLTCYANLPFPRLFKLQKQYREELKPIFEALVHKPT
jgi:hypothetical protein